MTAKRIFTTQKLPQITRAVRAKELNSAEGSAILAASAVYAVRDANDQISARRNVKHFGARLGQVNRTLFSATEKSECETGSLLSLSNGYSEKKRKPRAGGGVRQKAANLERIAGENPVFEFLANAFLWMGMLATILVSPTYAGIEGGCHSVGECGGGSKNAHSRSEGRHRRTHMRCERSHEVGTWLHALRPSGRLPG